ncbi:PUR family DNA/RNA-binding protein [Psychroflexus sp. YR1-1]|uniref:PUR family DNA/RNA-binding protein n=1 Tax=Psychroflexus aurantiacus TaxID=2709310 RepID=A0A6B3R0I5_9FLAO|nr:PUR family DNA/RNA-binding protein [Psychroflexus aurantiacus]NEV93692.1 PUR family DNA/RNA-binding protein [Psychroflexus aurantiacus]
MSDQGPMKNEDIFSKVIRAGRRTYFFDVRSTKADDYYLTITESKKFTNDDGSFFYRKHKIYLYKEDFENFKEALDETTNFIIDNKGEEVISDRHQKDFTKPSEADSEHSTQPEPVAKTSAAAFTNISFDDI